MTRNSALWFESVSIMSRRSPRLHPNDVSDSEPSRVPPGAVSSESTSAGAAAPDRGVSPPAPNTNRGHDLCSSSTRSSITNTSIPPVNSITLTIAFTNNDDSVIDIRIINDRCTITEDYIAVNNEKSVSKSTIPLKNLATYLYTLICAACLDEHLTSWKSVQFLCTFLPAMYITRAQLPHKRELIIQTLISHIQNLLGGF